MTDRYFYAFLAALFLTGAVWGILTPHDPQPFDGWVIGVFFGLALWCALLVVMRKEP